MSKAFSALQQEVVEKYQEGEFSMVTPYDDLNKVGDSLFTFAVREAGDASDREEFVAMMRTAISDLEALVVAVESESPGSKAVIPLADRYARDVLDDPSQVVCLEVQGVKYVEIEGEVHVEGDQESPDFYSVYARVRNAEGDALAQCIGDFASPDAAREYAVHVAKWMSPAWEVHELTTEGWVPLNAVEDKES